VAAEKSDAVNRMLDFLEENIDEDHCRAVEKKHLEALFFKPGAELPLSFFIVPKERLRPNIEMLNNPEAMLHNELIKSFGSVINSVRIKDDYPLHIRSNHGVVLCHCMAGGAYKTTENETPWALPLEETIEEYRRKWEGKPYDIKNNELIKRVCETYRYMAQRLSEYPVCKRTIRLTHPDMQGIFDIAQSLFGERFFYELYDNPEDVHWLLKRITDGYIELFKLFDGLVNNYTENREAVYIHGGIYPGRVLLKNDTATAMLSESHYDEFCRTYDKKIAEALGNICIHYCGKSQDFHYRVIGMDALRGLNFGNPEMQNVEDFLRRWNTRHVAAVCWGMNRGPEFLYHSLGSRTVTGFTLCCNTNDAARAAELIKRYRETGVRALAAEACNG
jgi:hypothetical protein